MEKFKRFLIGIAIGIVILVSILGGAVSERLFGYKVLDKFFPRKEGILQPAITQQRILTEESVVIDVAEKVSPSVVTVGVTKTQRVMDLFEWDPFMDPFGFFRQPRTREEKIKQDIGSGFIIDKDGLIVTNKHVVADTNAKYRVITKDDKEYEVKKIYRDPVNDLAILKIEASGLKPVELGDSDKLKVGQFVIAIGTALGEFRHTVTTGVISGLGRGITAGSPFEGYVERLDNVIQTDAAINPGNSGGPLLNSAGQVIGVNVAVAAEGQNIGFALPINLVKESLATFEKTGKFERPFLGVRYRMISQDLALLNDVPQGAYIVEVVSGSPADKAGIKQGDIITKLDGQPVREKDGGLAKLVASKKIGESVRLTIWREGKEQEVVAVLETSNE
ncbi:MAG: S1C family serine protease [Microgenomates group bacterium]